MILRDTLILEITRVFRYDCLPERGGFEPPLPREFEAAGGSVELKANKSLAGC